MMIIRKNIKFGLNFPIQMFLAIVRYIRFFIAF
jgi:hypothetical protein